MQSLHQTLLALFVYFMAMPAFGQIYMSSNGNNTAIITRSDDASGNRMHYVKTGATAGVFLHSLTLGGNSPYFGGHSVSGYNINDFTIFNDTVYFCGEDTSGIGFYGWTSATGFNWTLNIKKLYSSGLATSYDMSRIKVFRSGSDLNVLLIGTYQQNGSRPFRSLFHIKNNNTCTVAYGDVEYFEDIALLDDYVVTIERKKSMKYDHAPRYLRVLGRNSFTLYDPLFDFYYFNYGEIESVGDVRLQTTGSNRLVAVYCRDSAYYINTYTVNFSGILSLHRYYSIATTSLPTIGDLAYNSTDNTLVVLHNVGTAGTAMLFNCSSFPLLSLTGSYIPYLTDSHSPLLPVQTRLLSVTRKPSSGYVITGLYGGKSVFWNAQNSGCQFSVLKTATSTVSSAVKSRGATHRVSLEMVSSTVTAVIGSFNLSTPCVVLPFGDSELEEQEENN